MADMKYKSFWIPAQGGEAFERELDSFLARHSVVQVEKMFCQQERGWSILVEFCEPVAPSPDPAPRSRIDYKEVLDADTFQIYAALRKWRNDRAAEEGKPMYVIAQNEHRATMAKDRITSVTGLKGMPGFGEARIKKYGAALVEQCRAAIHSLNPDANEEPVNNETERGSE